MLPQHRPYRGSGEGNIGDEISIGKWRLAFQGRPHTAIGRKVGIAWVEIIVCFRWKKLRHHCVEQLFTAQLAMAVLFWSTTQNLTSLICGLHTCQCLSVFMCLHSGWIERLEANKNHNSLYSCWAQWISALFMARFLCEVSSRILPLILCWRDKPEPERQKSGSGRRRNYHPEPLARFCGWS